MNRRTFLVAGAAGGLALATGATAFTLTRSPARALAPWRDAGLSQGDPRLFIVEHAVLAPSPHNRQPWIVELLPDGVMVLYCDLDRRLPQTDPQDRQIVIGLGAFVELASLAASRLGLGLAVMPFPEGEPGPRLDARPIARLEPVSAQVPPDPLFAHVRERRSTKKPFDAARPVPPDAVAALERLSGGEVAVAVVADPARVATIRDLTWQAWQIEAATPRTHRESVDLMRIGRREIEANPDGISLGGPVLEALALAGSLTREAMASPESIAWRQGFEMYRAMLAATGAYLTVTAVDSGRAGQLAAGRAYLRANLLAASLGLSLHPVSQALQEFPEMDGTRVALDRALGVASPARLHMLARLGYGPAVPPSPRWPAGTRIRSHEPKPA